MPPERLVYTFEYEGMPGHILVETVTFEEHDGKTTVTSTAVFDSVEDRDGMLESGMESGAIESWDRLEERSQSAAGVDERGRRPRHSNSDRECRGAPAAFTALLRTEPVGQVRSPLNPRRLWPSLLIGRNWTVTFRRTLSLAVGQ